MQDLLDRIAAALVAGGERLFATALAIIVLFVAHRVGVAIARRVADGAAAAPLPGEAGLPAEDRALQVAARRRRLDTLVLFATKLGRVVVVAAAVLVAIAILVPELIAALGALGVALGVAVGGAIGFGAQQLVRDYLNGILILGENPFSVGDVVALAGVRGTVEEVGLRRTIVRDGDGTLHSVPNGAIAVASNFTRTFARVNERFSMAAGTDIERAVAVLADACAAFADEEAWRGRFLEPPRVLGIEAAAAGEPGIPILVSATVRPGEQWEVAGALRRRAIEALRAAGIDLALGRTLLVAAGRRPDPAIAAEAEGGAEFT